MSFLTICKYIYIFSVDMEVLFCPVLFLTFSNCGIVHISEARISVKTLWKYWDQMSVLTTL